MRRFWKVSIFVVLALVLAILYSCSTEPEYDYNDDISNVRPEKPSNPYPEDGAIDVPVNVTLKWICSDPDDDELVYDVYLGTDPDNLSKVAENIEDNEFTPESLDYNTTYYWKVVADDEFGGVTESDIWHFTTEKSSEPHHETPSEAPSVKWQKVLGGSNDDEALSVASTTDGGFIVAGYTDSNDGDVENQQGSSDFWVIKFDENMEIEWARTYGGTMDEWARSIKQTSDGGYIVVGYTSSTDNWGIDVWVLKLKPDGSVDWQYTYGGNSSDYAYDVVQTNDGGYIIVGTTESKDVESFHGIYDFLVLKIDSKGKQKWMKAFGGSSEDEARSVVQTDDVGYIVVGYTYSNDGDVSSYKDSGDVWIIKIDGSGNKVWDKSFGGESYEEAWSITKANDGGYVIAGLTNSGDGDVEENEGGSDVWVIKIDDDGELKWQKTYGGSDNEKAYSIRKDNDGYVIAGYTASDNGDVTGYKGSSDFWVVKINNTGDLIWQKALGGQFDEVAFGAVQLESGDYIVAGYSQSEDGDLEENKGNEDIWIVKLGF